MLVPFNRVSVSDVERRHVAAAMTGDKLSGDGPYTKRCHAALEARYGFLKVLLTTSCTDALELAALLLEVRPGDEVIVPSYTFVSTANAFALRGARLVFADSSADNPNIDPAQIEALVGPRTKAIVVVHYAGIASEMDRILQIAATVGAAVIEDAAQALDASYRGRPLGSVGACAAFSFHDTKNLTCGEGGMLVVNDARLVPRAEILREKGTNRAAFFRGEIDRYGWIEVGSSFLPSELNAAFLWGQLERIDEIQSRRRAIFDAYHDALGPLLAPLGIGVPRMPEGSVGNAHAFYLVLRSGEERSALIEFLKACGVQSAFHYSSLHRSEYFKYRHDGRVLPHSDRYADCLLRLPLYHGLVDAQVDHVVGSVLAWVRSLA